MMRSQRFAAFFALLGALLILPTHRVRAAETVATLGSEAGPIRVVEVARGLEVPWSLAFLGNGRMLVTERPGRMRIVSADGRLSRPLAGLPRVQDKGQGGLLDVVLGPGFHDDGLIYFSYVEPVRDGARTAVARARLDVDGLRLLEVTRIFAQNDAPSGSHHWGARLVFDRQGNLFVTLGERFFHRDRAQDLNSHLGKIVRIRTDGTIPEENPFRNREKALAEIWSYGHRNVQGAALHPETGRLWAHEHGPQGGDEVNIILPGRNYGWPVITHGREYVTGFPIGQGTERADVEGPLHVWTPSIAPSGMAFYTGGEIPQWQGSLFVGALRGSMLVRLSLAGDRVLREERLLGEIGHRIRDVRQGPDGRLYLLDETAGRILRLSRP